MRRFGLCALAALGLFIILQFSLMGNAAVSATASVSEGAASTQSSQPIALPSSGMLFTESLDLLDEPARFQVPASGPEFEEFHSIPNAWPIASNEDAPTFKEFDSLNSRGLKAALANQNVELIGQIGGLTQAVAVDGDIAYLGVGPRLVIADISDPANLQVLGETDVLPGLVYDVVVVGSYAYVANYSGGLRIIDISTPAAPSEVSFVDTPGNAIGVAVAGNYAYVADGFSGLRIIDVSTPAASSEVGFVNTPGNARGVVVAGSYAYLADESSGLRIIDVSAPAAPSEVGFVDTPGTAYGVVIAGSYAYVADGSSGLRIIDVSTPAAPSQIGFVDTIGSAKGVAVADSYAYVADDYGGLRIIDVSMPAAPSLVALTSSIAYDVAVVDGYAYVADHYGLRIIDVSTPAAPSEVGFADTPSQARGVAVAGSYAYVTEHHGLRLIDVSTPAAPSEVSFVNTSGYAKDVVVAGSYAYVANDFSGLRIIDVSTPAAPSQVGFVDTPGTAYDVAVANSYAYVADGSSGLRIIDVSTPAAPSEVAFVNTPNYAYSVAVAGNYAYVAADSSGLRIIDVRTPAAPSEVGFVDTPGNARGVAVAGSYAYVADSSGLRIIDVSTPTAPSEVGSYDSPSSAKRVAVAGSYAYVADAGSGLRIIDVSTPAAPSEVGFYDTLGDARGVTVAGSDAYLADGSSGLMILRFTDPNAFEIAKSAPTTVTMNAPITYTLTITNSWHVSATNVLITDTLPMNATYLSGGTLAGNVVSWNLPTLAPNSTTSVQFVVTATETITNSDYGFTADDGYSATGSEVVVTEVTQPALLAIYALAFDTLPTNDLSWAYSDVMQGLRTATANDANKRAIVVVDMPGADNTLIYELEGGNETLISGLPDTSGDLSSAIHEYDMTDGATLGGFVLWARNMYPADKTTFSYVGHGAPLIPETDFDPIFDPNAPPAPSSPGDLFPLPGRQDAHPSFTDVTPNAKILSVYQLSEALRIGTNDGANPLDVADLVHCFASTIEEYVALHPYADAMTGSPNYAFFAPEMLGEALDGIAPSAEANTIADRIIKEYDRAIESHDDSDTPSDDHPRLLVAVDSDKIPAIKQKWNEVSYYLWQNFNKTKIENAYLNSAHYDTTYCLDENGTQDWALASPDAVVDLKKFATELKQEFGSPVSIPVNTLELLIDDAIINSYRQNGQPWFADVTPQPTWDFDNNSGIGIYADFVGTPKNADTHLSWHAHFYTDTVTTDNPHPYAFLQGDFAGINWADVFYRFWEGTSNLKTDACLPELPPLPDTGELAVTQIIFPQAATVSDKSPLQIMAVISTAHAAVKTTVAFTVTQSSTTVFSDVVHIPGVLMTGTHSVQASQAWVPALANPAVAEPFTLEVMVDHDNHVSETNELDNLLTMSDVVAPALANPRPIITATIANNLQWITDTTASLHVVQAASTQPPPVQTVEVQVYQYVAGSAPNTQVPVLLNSQSFSSLSLPQAVNVSLNGLTPGPVVLHVWGWSTGGVTVYPSIVKFNYIPPNTALAAGEQHDFLFNPNAGDTLEFDLNALTGDPNMFLWTPINFGVPTWSATAVGSDYLNPSAPVSGEYLLSVYGQSSGTYTLTTKRNGVPYARRAARANNPNAYVPNGRPTFSEPIPEAPSAVASTSISLQAGWNHTSLSLEPLVGYSAQTLCDQINEQGGDAVEIDRWHNGGWEGHVCGLPFNDFDLVLGESYFIRSNSASNWSIAGRRVTEALPLTVQTGWNSIAIPHTDSYTAESLCDDMISQGVDVVEIDRWHNSGWQGHICGVPFNNFDIERHTGYFIKSNSSGTMSPTARSFTAFRMTDKVNVAPEAVSTAQAVPIHDLQRSNLRDTSLTLSWTTQQATTGYVRFGETPETMSKVAYDSRGATTSRTTHRVVLNQLTPETSYYFEIISGAEVQKSDPSRNEREAYSVTTLSPLDNVPPSDTIYGQIYQADGVTPATGTLVYLQLQDADDAASPKEAGLISALVDEQGYWHANLGNARSTEGSGSFAYAMPSARLLLTTQSAAADTLTHTLDTTSLRPAQPLTLQPQARWQLYLPLIQN
ncbi:MAG: fibronectin type III domain-containing protein [Ardenticatenaceae bacterium]